MDSHVLEYADLRHRGGGGIKDFMCVVDMVSDQTDVSFRASDHVIVFIHTAEDPVFPRRLARRTLHEIRVKVKDAGGGSGLGATLGLRSRMRVGVR